MWHKEQALREVWSVRLLTCRDLSYVLARSSLPALLWDPISWRNHLSWHVFLGALTANRLFFPSLCTCTVYGGIWNNLFIKQLWHVIWRICLRVSVVLKKHHDHATLTEEKHLIGVFYFFRGLVCSPLSSWCDIGSVSCSSQSSVTRVPGALTPLLAYVGSICTHGA